MRKFLEFIGIIDTSPVTKGKIISGAVMGLVIGLIVLWIL